MPKSKFLIPMLSLLGIAVIVGAWFIAAERGSSYGISNCQILDRALAAYPGDLLGLTVDRSGPHPVWRIEIQGRDGKLYRAAYDTANGNMVDFAAQ